VPAEIGQRSTSVPAKVSSKFNCRLLAASNGGASGLTGHLKNNTRPKALNDFSDLFRSSASDRFLGHVARFTGLCMPQHMTHRRSTGWAHAEVTYPRSH
jgi:hypothetical protein